MNINAVTTGRCTFKGFSDDIKRARVILQGNSDLDEYLKDGKTVIIEKVEINGSRDNKSAHENLKKIGQGAAAGVAGGATGSVIAKSKNSNALPDDAIIDNECGIEDYQKEPDVASENISDVADNEAVTTKDVTEGLSDDDLADLSREMEYDSVAESAGGIFGFFKDFFKSLLDID